LHSLPNHAPSNVAALDARDPTCGNASHVYGIQYDGGSVCRIPFQHGPRLQEGSKPGVFDDDLLAVLQDRMEGFQAGPFACVENGVALEHIRAAREALSERVARRISQGVLGKNESHVSPPVVA